MFSRIFATDSIAVPATNAVFFLDRSSVARPATSRVRWTRMTRRMYAASLAPRVAMMRSRSASSSWPRRSTSASDRCAAALGRFAGPPAAARIGFLGRIAASSADAPVGVVVAGRFTVVVMGFPFSDVQVDGAGGGVDAGLDQLALVAVHLPGAQVADLAGDQRCQAAAADAHAAPARHDDAAAFPGVEERHVAADLDLLVGLLEDNDPALAAGSRQQDRGEALDGEAGTGVVGAVDALALPQRLGVVEQLGRGAGEGLAGAPVGAEGIEVGGGGEVEAAPGVRG